MVFKRKYTAVARAAKTMISHNVAKILKAGIAQFRKSGFKIYLSARFWANNVKLSILIRPNDKTRPKTMLSAIWKPTIINIGYNILCFLKKIAPRRKNNAVETVDMYIEKRLT